ncbi:acyltransferase [Herbiconiux sp. L3-i23]|uniref:acyltransferase family protein n=1 Tax=Herbiconiux sp. L3-i23 TaxID=2905871 RepID=UPI00204FEA7E|nr:acyltransferase [Herbiconiux sp. L3-i23]BDI21630.1 O-antigen acetylase [Herbiconiux sp. L3-i23]
MTVRTLGDAFDPRNNSIGFLRWVMAFMVIFSHAGPVAGLFHGADIGEQWGAETSLGGVAVTGFFFLSGMLITRSMMTSRSPARFLWHRVVRIFPAWFAILIVTAFVLAPIAWIHDRGTISGFSSAQPDSPWDYVYNNVTLVLNQWAIAGTGADTPAVQFGYNTWNGSAWTLMYEFACYLAVLVLGLIGALTGRLVGAIIAAGVLVLSTLQAVDAGDLATVFGTLGNPQVLQLAAPFAFGTLVQLFIDKIPYSDRLGVGMIIVAGLSWWLGGWFLVGQYAFGYGLIWFGTRVRALAWWGRRVDLSYGIYIAGWPVMFLAADLRLQEAGWFTYLLVVTVAVHVYGYLSWTLIEKPALDLKNWRPRLLASATSSPPVPPKGLGASGAISEAGGGLRTQILARARFVPLAILMVATAALVVVGAIR